MPGFLSNGVCFESQQDAIDNHFSTMPVFQFTDYYNVHLYTVFTLDPAAPSHWSKYTYWLFNNGLYSVQQLQQPILPSCYSPMDAYADGQSIGWAFALVLSSVLLLVVVRRFF